MIGQIIFIVLLLATLFFFYQSVQRLRRSMTLGSSFSITDNKGTRWKNVLLLAFGQKKMFQRPWVALMHFVVYAGFLIVNIELLEIVIDGITGKHRIFQPYLGSFYPALITFFEAFAVGVLLVCVAFLVRRTVMNIRRFKAREMTSWPKLDANLILIFEIVLMVFLLSMNATDTLLHNTEGYFFSNMLIPLYDGLSESQLHMAERVFWWAHIVGVFFFANYVMYSKHLHIFLAFPNAYFARLEPNGKMKNMDAVTNEVKMMLGMQAEGAATPPEEIGRFGAKDVTDLSNKSLLDAFACTECGRCTDECPANLTGKLLSPRKIMMDTRDRAEELEKVTRKDKEATDNKSLLGDYITKEELYACTSCNACVQACPVSINPLDIITELRRYKIMEESDNPQEWNGMYQNIETSFNPWKFPPTDRAKWTENLG